VEASRLRREYITIDKSRIMSAHAAAQPFNHLRGRPLVIDNVELVLESLFGSGVEFITGTGLKYPPPHLPT
jgi:hypothetical protein